MAMKALDSFPNIKLVKSVSHRMPLAGSANSVGYAPPFRSTCLFHSKFIGLNYAAKKSVAISCPHLVVPCASYSCWLCRKVSTAVFFMYIIRILMKGK